MVRLGALAATALIGMSATAFAADMGIPTAYPSYPALQQEVPVELGTGWYLRGDATFAREMTPQVFGAPGAVATSAPAGSQLLNTGGTKNGWALGLGFGYQFNNWVRADLTYEYRNAINANASSAQFDCQSDVAGINDISSGDPIGIAVIYNKCTAGQKASLKRHVGLANVYFDLGTWSGLTPYVGAGVGVSYSATTASYNWYNAADGSMYGPTFVRPAGYPLIYSHINNMGQSIPGQPVNYGAQSKYQAISSNSVAFAWALMAGFAYQLTDRAKIDIGYRYLNMGNPSKASGSKALTSNEVRVGFRYAID
ncbi:outer membrane beta-barrel protein [Methylocella sp. CPCC 101449]|jgi:opacity protein-like surface antigen|uniref:outer membrane protein n=1 Tax=Methylocella sp. CPCC 101449 TaxID=2987531 RepID=UPI00288F1943|nr:outer membrane beta-barrel protein [Methylocella sp. CPCC 101449]MDT2020970.1 outer membrane beta-barrel protein [Methylocella sp. CPCC 101449]HEV2570773.1 outer membrane beta-barrel protein [Beijerinckiaceae bacterium]